MATATELPPWPLLIRLIGGATGVAFAGVGTPPEDLLGEWLEFDIGDRLDRINALVEHPTEDVRLVIEGYTETIRHRGWAVQLNAEPYDPWQIGLLSPSTGAEGGADLGRLAGDDACALRVAVDSDDVSFPFDPNAFHWTTVVDDFIPPLRVRLGGELVDLSAITTTPATFVAAGVVAHAVNAAVTPGMPAGVAANDLLFVFAAIRNSGTGVPVTPDGYTRLPIFNSTDNAQVYAKVHDGSESDPTITFTGGVANADTSAQMAAFRNMPITLTDLTDIVLDSRPQLNGSTADIATPHLMPGIHPGCVVLAFGWKQDDWTSVAPPSGFTEIGEPDTTTGDDQGITWAYRIDTAPAMTLISSFVVTGGASAISRSAVAGLAAGFQTMTVSARSTNGVVKSHTAGTPLEVEDVLVLGL